MQNLSAHIFNDSDFADIVQEHGIASVVTALTALVKDIGIQRSQRNARLSESRDQPDYKTVLAEHNDWVIASDTVRRVANRRHAELKPTLQAERDRAQADRRALVRLAKRVWMWEQGHDHRLDEALDDLDVSSGETGRLPLRQVIDRLVESSAGDLRL